MKREEVIRLCHEQAVPIYHGKIDKSLFQAVREELTLVPLGADAARRLLRRLVTAPRILLAAARFCWPSPRRRRGAPQASTQGRAAWSRARSSRGSHTGLAVYDRTARALPGGPQRPRPSFGPASNMKLATSAALLDPVRPIGRLHTRIMASGPLAAGTVTGNLWLVGAGDPSLATEPFARAAYGGARDARARPRGRRRVPRASRRSRGGSTATRAPLTAAARGRSGSRATGRTARRSRPSR